MAASKTKKAVDHWMRKAFKPSRKGKMHRMLIARGVKGVKLGEKIPASVMNAALAGRYGKTIREEAQAAHNANK